MNHTYGARVSALQMQLLASVEVVYPIEVTCAEHHNYE